MVLRRGLQLLCLKDNWSHSSHSHLAAQSANIRSMSSQALASAKAEAEAGKSAIFQGRYVDIGINLTDPIYTGIYHGTQRHANDLEDVLKRAREVGCEKLIITGSDLEESKKAIELAEGHSGLYTTVGVHPCSCLTFINHPTGPSALLSALKDLATSAAHAHRAVAFGEIGLDYDRLSLCDKETQLKYFAAQLDIACTLDPPLPLFLHSRAAATDVTQLLRTRLDQLPKRGVVHSFTGGLAEMQELVAMGFDIGINGCSLKTEENLEVVREVPLERLQLETDGPWCEVRASHAGTKYLKEGGWDEDRFKSVKKEKFVEGAMVKGRNEPCLIDKVAIIVAGVKGLSLKEVSEAAWRNTHEMFDLER